MAAVASDKIKLCFLIMLSVVDELTDLSEATATRFVPWHGKFGNSAREPAIRPRSANSEKSAERERERSAVELIQQNYSCRADPYRESATVFPTARQPIEKPA